MLHAAGLYPSKLALLVQYLLVSYIASHYCIKIWMSHFRSNVTEIQGVDDDSITVCRRTASARLALMLRHVLLSYAASHYCENFSLVSHIHVKVVKVLWIKRDYMLQDCFLPSWPCYCGICC